MNEDLNVITRKFSATVAVIGDFMLDEYIFGRVTRISPESPVPVVDFGSKSHRLGGAGNVAGNIRALGGCAIPLGVVGDDQPGETILKAMQRDLSADTAYMLRDGSRTTTVKCRVMAQHQQLLRIDYESRNPLSETVQNRLLDNLSSVLPGVGAIVVSDYNKGCVSRSLLKQLVTIATTAHVPLLLDPKKLDLAGIGGVTVITPNEKEAEFLSGVTISGQEAVEEAGRILLEKTGALNIVITRGEHGMTLFRAGADPVHLPAHAREVYDVTGAGDTVVAALSLALASGATMQQATTIANVAAAIVVGKLGTATVSVEELEAALKDIRTAARHNVQAN